MGRPSLHRAEGVEVLHQREPGRDHQMVGAVGGDRLPPVRLSTPAPTDCDVIVDNDKVDSFKPDTFKAPSSSRKRKEMEPDLNQERRQAHALLDMLPAEKLNAVRSLLEVMVEPLARSLALAPVEEEEITPETAQALDRARASLARGEGIPHEEILREFGLHQ
jgi:hypothetical protein